MTTATARRATTVRAPARQKSATPPKPKRQTTTSASESKRTAAAHTPRRPRASTDVTDVTRQATSKRPVRHAALAAERAVRRNTTQLRLPIVGELTLPAPEQVVFIGGVAVLAVIGVLEWPVAVLLAAGHALAANAHAKIVRSFGEALEEA